MGLRAVAGATGPAPLLKESLRDWSLRLRPLGPLCFRLGSPRLSSLSHMQVYSLLTLESHLVLTWDTIPWRWSNQPISRGTVIFSFQVIISLLIWVVVLAF